LILAKVFRYDGPRAKLTSSELREGICPIGWGMSAYCYDEEDLSLHHHYHRRRLHYNIIYLYRHNRQIPPPSSRAVSVLCNTHKPTHTHARACVLDMRVTRQPWNHNHVRTHDVPRRAQAAILYLPLLSPPHQPTVSVYIYIYSIFSISRLFIRLVFGKGKKLFDVSSARRLSTRRGSPSDKILFIKLQVTRTVMRPADQWHPRRVCFRLCHQPKQIDFNVHTPIAQSSQALRYTLRPFPPFHRDFLATTRYFVRHRHVSHAFTWHFTDLGGQIPLISLSFNLLNQTLNQTN